MVLRRLNNVNTNIKFSYSYGGKIVLRHGVLRYIGVLHYIGGHTRLLSVHPSISYSELMVKLADHSGYSIRLKCQLPNGDLETLVSITSDEELEAIILEYDAVSPPSLIKIKAILSPPKSIKYVSPPTSNSSSIAGNIFPPPPPVKYGCLKIENPTGTMPVSSQWNGYTKLGSPVGSTTPHVSSHWSGYPQIGSTVGSPGAMTAAAPYWHVHPHAGRPATAMTAAAPQQHGYPQIGNPASLCVREEVTGNEPGIQCPCRRLPIASANPVSIKGEN